MCAYLKMAISAWKDIHEQDLHCFSRKIGKCLFFEIGSYYGAQVVSSSILLLPPPECYYTALSPAGSTFVLNFQNRFACCGLSAFLHISIEPAIEFYWWVFPGIWFRLLWSIDQLGEKNINNILSSNPWT